ncbi:MAG: hypothetical protein B7Z82_00520 [Halothiobacillus sp. 20-54-6]|nr:MAG: hypothetical protein B7Z82_00520 [Halothiobacillus sp. 20-54-6]
MTQPKPGVYVYDFGQNQAGVERVRVLTTGDVEFLGPLARSKDKMVIVTANARNKVGLVVSVLDASKQAGALKLAVMKAVEGGS